VDVTLDKRAQELGGLLGASSRPTAGTVSTKAASKQQLTDLRSEVARFSAAS
jgi:hypothetical protein